jgi:hypothetical protein
LNKTQQKNLGKAYADFTISDVYKVEDEEGSRFFAVVENSHSKIILKSVGNGWEMMKSSHK